jgi:integrase/recombinase XerD
MSELRTRMTNDMVLRRFSPRTQQSYLDAVKGLAVYYHAPPDQLDPQQIQAYLLHLTAERKLAWSSVNVAVSGLRFFYHNTLGWERLQLIIPPRKRPSPLPEVLSVEEVEQLFAAASNPKHRVLLMTTYATGMRVSEVVRLTVSDIHSERMMVRVEKGKGEKDRYTVLSERLLVELRAHFRRVRPLDWLFFGADRSRPLSASTAQRAYTATKQRAALTRGKGIHTLRHCFATHLLEAGVDVKVIQELMGHASILTTMRYLQVTRKTIGATRSPLDLLPKPEDVPDPSS